MSGDGRLKCPKCGAPVFDTDTECMNCGAELVHGRLAGETQPQPASPGVHVDHGVAQVHAGAVEYRTLPTAGRLDWGELAGGGFFAALSRSWRFFTACLEMLAGYPLMVVPALLSVLVGFAILAATVAALYVTGLWQYVSSDKPMPPEGWAILIAGALVSYAALLSFMGMIAHMVDAYLRGRRATLGQALADVLQNLPALLYLAVVNTAVSVLLAALRGRSRSWAGRAATDAADRARSVANHLIVPIIMIEDKPFSAAAKRAYQLFRYSILDVVVAEVGLLMLNKAVAFVLAVVLVAGVVAARSLAPVLLPVVIGAAALLVVLAAALTSFIRTAYYTCLYLWAAAMEAVGSEEVPAPEPIAKALAA